MPTGDDSVGGSSCTDAGRSRSAAAAAIEDAGDAVMAAASAQPSLEHAMASGAASAISHAALTRAQTQLRQDSLDRPVSLHVCIAGATMCITGAKEPPAP